MKKPFVILSLVFASLQIFAQATKPPKVNIDNLPNLGYRSVPNTAFRAGESVQYRIHYGMVNAGLATLSVEESQYKFNGRDAYHIVGKGQSLGSFDWFFKVRDHYETYIDKQGLFPYRFIRNCDEGGYKINQDYTFHPEKRAYKDAKGTGYMTPDFVQDMLSSYYYARCVDYSQAKKGDIFTIMTLVDGEIFPLKMKYIGKDKIKIDIGTFNCLKFVPVIQKGRIFKKEDDLCVWISDDGNHLPVLVKAKIMVGSVKIELQQYSGISNQLAQVFE
jgi:Protein of unknown function (DUF3108)